MKNVLLVLLVFSMSAIAQNNKARTDGISYFVKARVDTGNCLIDYHDTKGIMSLADGYVKVQLMKDGNIKDTCDAILYLNQGQVYPYIYIRKVYSLWNGSDSCQTKIYIGNTQYTGLYVGL